MRLLGTSFIKKAQRLTYKPIAVMVSNRTLFQEWLLLTTFISVLVSCEMVVDIDLPEEPPRLVVNHIIETNQSITPRIDFIQITQSQSTLNNEDILSVSGALVTMWEESECTMLREMKKDCQVTFEEELPRFPGRYRQSVLAYFSPGKTYMLRVEKVGFETITATTRIPEPTKISRISYDTTVVLPPVVSQRSFNVDEVRLTLDDPAEEHNYYAIRVQAERRREKCDSVGNCTLANSSYVTSYVEISSSNPAVLSSNYALQGSTTRIYGYQLPFSDELFNGEEYTVSVNPDIFFYGDSLRPYLNVELITMTQEQYDYEYHSWLQQSLQEVSYSEPVLVPGNVEGGFGIFAGYSVDGASIDFQ